MRVTTIQHQHSLVNVVEGRCGCGTILCRRIKPTRGEDAAACTLEKGHDGPHRNHFAPEYGTWE